MFALIEGPELGAAHPATWLPFVVGVALLAAFVAVERRVPEPIVPLALFGSRRFTGANLTTLTVYAALNVVLFLVVVQLQDALGYSALAEGAALVPINVLLLVLSPAAGRLAERVGHRLPLTVGPLVAAGGLLLMVRVRPGASYVADVLPAVVVFGLGLAATVAPLTSAAGLLAGGAAIAALLVREEAPG